VVIQGRTENGSLSALLPSCCNDIADSADELHHDPWGEVMWHKRITNWLLIVLLWLGLAFVASSFYYSYLTSYGKPVTWMSVARRQFAAYLIWGAVLTPSILWFCRRYPIDKATWRSALVRHVGASLAAGLVHAALRLPLDHFVYPEPGRHVDLSMLRGYFMANGYDDMWMYWMVVFLAHGLTYYRKYRDRSLLSAQLESQLAQAQLQALRLQLQPHFLFNTLHSISTLMHRDVEAADRMITQLSDLLRVSLESAGVQEIPLKLELEFLRGYLEIEQTRFQDRLSVVMNVDPEALDGCVPNMLLQPLVENAVRHGVAKRAGPGRIQVTARRTNGFLRLAVRDDGPGLGQMGELRAGGVGLTNTRARLQCLYGAEHSFQAHDAADGGLEVEMEIPFRKAEDTEDASRMLTVPLSARPIAHEVQ
jgi:two-component system LytT family sensor kinase